MNETNAIGFLSRLLQREPGAILSWVDRVRAGQQEAPEDFNWFGLAEVAAFEASSRSDLAWAHVAIAAYEYLAGISSAKDCTSYMLSSMNVRASMIDIFGSRPGDPVLDVERLVGWFFDGLALAHREAGVLTKSLRELSIDEKLQHLEELRQLREIKNRLSVLKIVVASGKLHPSPELQLWLSLRDELP